MAGTAGWLAVIGGVASAAGAYLAIGWLNYLGAVVAIIGGIMAMQK